VSTLPRAHGEAVLQARYRVEPEDFQVEEIDGFEPTGQGEHLLLTVEKRGMNTSFAAKRIARWAGIPEMGVGYAGMKDRHAVTRQRFSVHFPKRMAPDLEGLVSDDLRVLASTWHNRKLPRGALKGNRFVLRLRDVVGDPAAIQVRLEAIAAHGLPNYFGNQRFGREGDNVEAARTSACGRSSPRPHIGPVGWMSWRAARARISSVAGSGPNTLWLPSSIQTSPSPPVAQSPRAMRAASAALNISERAADR
jgi:tRNA pseudouridine13 synthase